MFAKIQRCFVRIPLKLHWGILNLEPKAAIALAPKLPASKDRDEAISSLCYLLVRNEGADAAKAMLPLISEPKIREGMRNPDEPKS